MMTTNNPSGQGNYAPVNGLNLYYEVHGTGNPLVLIHGGLGGIEMFAGNLLPELAQTQQVIVVEMQGHGHTADIDRPFSYEQMADDVATLITHLGLPNADVVGLSLGGGIAWQTAIRHPDVVRKLVVISAPCKREGWYPEVLVGQAALNAEMAKTFEGSPPHQAYIAVAPQPENWPLLVTKTSDLLKQDYDWSAQVAALTTPTLILMGDADSVRTSHAVEMFALLGGGQKDSAFGELPASQLAILPGATHFTTWVSPLAAQIIRQFLA